MVGENLDKYTFQFFMQSGLLRVPDIVDKREGSIIFDTLAPSNYNLADYMMELKNIVLQTYVLTGTGEWLDMRVAEQGIYRYEATKAIRRADFSTLSGAPLAVPVDSRFSTISETTTYIYRVLEPYKNIDGIVIPGAYTLECETPGTVGNGYIGELLPISYIQGLATATMSSLLTPARNVETDNELRARYIAEVNNTAFGGNIYQYDKEVRAISGVGDLQIYPIWNGGGTVKLSVIDADYNPITPEFMAALQVEIDPEDATGDTGIGLGLAPIGHKVTITTPITVTCNITAELTLSGTTTISDIQAKAEQEIESYMFEVRKTWGVPDAYNRYSAAVYRAQLSAAILRVPGIANVTNLMINGTASDRILTQTAALQEIPVKGSVVFNA